MMDRFPSHSWWAESCSVRLSRGMVCSWQPRNLGASRVFMFFSFFKKNLSFLFLYFYVFSVFIIIFYNKNIVFLFHFCIFVYLDASLKFGEIRHTSFFFK
jgi:hypothetical protein